ncbi:MAG: hypothetical protein LBC79_04025 [Deltaproteobacteria bacterium]|jgi:hypothetical protein|nr:hypothetical protein [Deltaproteobacteria bacterium]
MKVRVEQLNALLQQEQAAQKASSRGEGFETLLAKELRQPGGGAQGTPPPPPGAQAGVISQMLLEPLAQAETDNPMEDVLQQSFQQASGLLDSVNAYVNALSARGADGNLKAIYPLLEGLEQQMGALKQGAMPLEEKHAGLASLINELEVLTTTEKFKFNRGDYI